MGKFIAMTALALILTAGTARAEYTGNGAISSGEGSSGSASSTDSSADAAKQRLKDDWDKFKTSHEQTWEKLEAARRAHWHGASASDSAATDTDGGDAGDSSSAAPSAGGDGPKPSRWEKFKESHHDQKDALQQHAEDTKSHLASDKQAVTNDVKQWSEKHHGTVAAAKEKVQQWESDHKDKIDAVKASMKDKWDQWHAGH